MLMRVLIAEDDLPSLLVLKNLVSSLGHTVVECAKDGLELVELFKQHKDNIDLVLSDVMMPNMNGLEAIREIKKIKCVVCVAVTAFDHGTQVLDNKNLYIPWTVCDLFMRKPVTKTMLNNVFLTVEETLKK